MATREPNLEPRRETMCFLVDSILAFTPSGVDLESVPNVTSHKLALMRRGIHQNPLNEIVAILISRY